MSPYYRNHRNGKYNNPTSMRAAHVNIPNNNDTNVELNADNTSNNSSELDSITTPFLHPLSPGESNYQNNINRKTLLKKFPINKYTVDEVNDYITNIIKCLQTGQYECKTTNPTNKNKTPHSCGRTCGKKCDNDKCLYTCNR
ncbi:13212_t:CDS:2 [Entrophospora sp. SA101]|nr:13212_t:CDS:2 [Entrophospora sp. SA101]